MDDGTIEMMYDTSAERIRCEFPDNLPITAKIPEIRSALKAHQVIVVCGTTGSGKTTQLPKAARRTLCLNGQPLGRCQGVL